MKEGYGNIWTYDAKHLCIPTNGTIKRNGCGVMSKGVASEAQDYYPGIDRLLGDSLRLRGNVFVLIATGVSGHLRGKYLYVFPTQRYWFERSDLDLIQQSAISLGVCAKQLPDDVWVLPRPGCGNSGLRWEDVRPIITPLLPDNVHVITLKG